MLFCGMGRRQDVPAGSLTLDRSQSESVFLSSSYTLAGRFCLGMRAAIESAFCVGAAKIAAGVSAKSRLKDAGKIIFVVAGCVGVDVGRCAVMVRCVTVDPSRAITLYILPGQKGDAENGNRISTESFLRIDPGKGVRECV